ncbi:hypothetical protein IX321_000358 [Bacteroides pyogenes]|nr:hypothetical protein [Bacteroides pyogenes]MBR8716673.1 hypothetical protein [Bacteroides pyogenes]MBR8745955.1 hypothetical protein [Bacteroides pyogenes]MBR8756231.1 hypothetical protein [Bacteroides pyogenes]MBR8779458.1 hypothetical protein [Bacteroides pyogenes]
MISSCDGFLFLCILYRHVIGSLAVSGEVSFCFYVFFINPETLGVVERFPVFFAFGHYSFCGSTGKNVWSISSFS